MFTESRLTVYEHPSGEEDGTVLGVASLSGRRVVLALTHEVRGGPRIMVQVNGRELIQACDAALHAIGDGGPLEDSDG